MQEFVFDIRVSDIRLSAVLFDEAFRMKRMTDPQGAVTQLKAIHQHSTYEIFFVLDGTLSITGEHCTVAARNAVAIVPPRYSHYTVSEEAVGYCMYFSPHPSQKNGLYEAVLSALKDRVSIFPIDEEVHFYILRLAELFEGNGDRENAEHLLPLLFSALFRRFDAPLEKKRSTHTKHGTYVNALDLYIAAHYCERIRLSDLAATLYLCPKQVARIIQKEYGCTLSELVNKRRLSAASMLLKYSTLDVGQIAATVGYEHENYFFTLFRRAYGMTPAKYRDMHRQAPT